jgi:hypothetical protein
LVSASAEGKRPVYYHLLAEQGAEKPRQSCTQRFSAPSQGFFLKGPAGFRQEVPMDRIYHLFEILPDGSTLWKGGADEEKDALQKLNTLARISTNEIRVVDIRTKKIVARKAGEVQADKHSRSILLLIL